MNRRYCYCKIPEPNDALVPTCEYCGYIISSKNLFDTAFYRRQIKGLILIMQDADEKDIMVSREYIIEKLTMMLNGGMNFHPTIIKHLDGLEDKK